ncbi:hypothetical protein NC652_002406 [Populus alba x Populus x berolinensis]|nr:hypothetical protein NC652_002406 [Populus alba x Populus x berolinensis]
MAEKQPISCFLLLSKTIFDHSIGGGQLVIFL